MIITVAMRIASFFIFLPFDPDQVIQSQNKRIFPLITKITKRYCKMGKEIN